MDPVPRAIIPRLILTPKDGFLARVAFRAFRSFRAVSLHSREVNPHGVFITP